MPGARLELARLTTTDLKSVAATNYATQAGEAWAGIEPAHGSFADSCVTTSPPRLTIHLSISILRVPYSLPG